MWMRSRWIPIWTMVLSAASVDAAPQGSNREAEARETRELRDQVKLLSDQLMAVNARLAGIEAREGKRAFAPGVLSGAPEVDPLAQLEAQLGGGAPPAPPPESAPLLNVAPEMKPVADAIPAAPVVPEADPLAGLERQVSAAPSQSSMNAQTAFNPRLSVIGDFTYNNSSLDQNAADPDANDLPTGDFSRDRFSLRELEFSFQAIADPYGRVDAYLALPGVLEEFEDDAAEANEQKIEVEEAFITFWRLPLDLQMKAGKFRLEFGKNNLLHTHALESVDRPFVISNTFSGEGLRETGLGLQGYIPLGTEERSQLELTGQVVNGEGGEETLFAGPGSDKTMALARARFFHQFRDPAHVIDAGASYLTGRHDPAGRLGEEVHGLDFTYRYEPLAQMDFKRLMLRAEYIQSARDVENFVLGIDEATGEEIPTNFPDQLITDGMYALALYQWDRRFAGGYRYDLSAPTLDIIDALGGGVLRDQDEIEGNTFWLTYLHSEFNRWRFQYSQRTTNFDIAGKRGEDLFLFQWTWALGPHGSHPY